jgi:ubiquitin C-terminal hydrolase
LHLPEDEETNLSDCINMYQIESAVDDYLCETCNVRGGNICHKISTTPAVMIISLKWFKNANNKNNINVKIDKIVTINNTQFQLTGLIKHDGEQLVYGHYTSVVLDYSNGNWYRCDDWSVTQIPLSDVLSISQSYILTYINIGQKDNWNAYWYCDNIDEIVDNKVGYPPGIKPKFYIK